MASSATQVEKTTLSKKNNSVAIWEFPAINLVFDIQTFDARVVLKAFNINFVIEVTNVTNNGVVLHLSHVLCHDNIFVSSCSDKDISSVDH
jgi:hypothetical protein